MTASELKHNVENIGKCDIFFDRSTMKFFGDTMKNYGVCSDILDSVPVWVLYRKRAVKNNLRSSTYFTKDTFKRVHKTKETYAR